MASKSYHLLKLQQIQSANYTYFNTLFYIHYTQCIIYKLFIDSPPPYKQACRSTDLKAKTGTT